MNLRQQLKFTAKGYLSAGRPSPMMFGISALAIVMILQLLDNTITGATQRNAAMIEAAQQYAQNNNTEYLLNAMTGSQPTFVQTLLSAMLSVMLIMISTGIVIFVIMTVRHGKGSFGNLFDGLSVLLRVVIYQVLSTVFVFLWSLLLVIPGIMAAYSYRQGLYILLDHPEMSVMECLRASKHMMKGNKMELFVMDLSFFGWAFAESAFATIMSLGFEAGSFLPSLFVLPVSAFVRMYMEFTMFLYYEHLHGVHYDPRVRAADPTQN